MRKWRLDPIFLIVWAIAIAYMFHHIRGAFYDVDEGLLAQTAERVLHGQLPHRDFTDVYTGGLSMLHALALRVFGASFMATRWMLLVAVACWVPILYWIAARIARPAVAGFVVLVAVVWSVAQHPRAMPTWYTLFLATAGTAAILRFVDTRQRRWLVAAGVAAGVSCDIKIVGLYFIAAALLFFVYDEQETDLAPDAAAPRRWYAMLIDVGVIGYALAVAWLVRGQGLRALVQYALPNAAVAALLVFREHTASYLPPARRWAVFWRMVGPFLAGVALPIVVFLIPYLLTGSVGALVHGVFVEPFKRLVVIAFPPPRAISVLMAIPVLVALGLVGRGSRLAWLAAAVSVGLVAASGSFIDPDPTFNTPPHVLATMLRQALYGLIPALVILGVVRLARQRNQPTLALLVFVLASGTLVQFPCALDQYFNFVAPLVALVALALVIDLTPEPRWRAAVVALALLVWDAGRLELALYNGPKLASMDVPRGGPLVEWFMAPMYEKLVALVNAHARGRYIYAGPDSPHVYFVTAKENFTPTIYEVFDERADRTDSVLRQLDTLGVTAVVINRHRNVSGPMDPRLEAALVSRFPSVDSVGAYVVRWREGAPGS
jgi:hypothetical protein